MSIPAKKSQSLTHSLKIDRNDVRKVVILKVKLKGGSLWFDVISAGADSFLHVVVAVASGRETFAAN